MLTAKTARPATLIALAVAALALAGCKAQDDSSSVTNMVIDNTVGTASDKMTDVDATTGSAANMSADVGSNTQPDASNNSTDSGDASDNSTK